MSGESSGLGQSGTTTFHTTAANTQRYHGPCTRCRAKKLKCDRELPCKQCSTRQKSGECTFTHRDGGHVGPISIERTGIAENGAGVPADIGRGLGKSDTGRDTGKTDTGRDTGHTEIVALRRTVEELLDRVWRTEIQLAAAGFGQSTCSGNATIEKALEDMVTLVTQRYTDLAQENRRLSAQVNELQMQMQVQVQVQAQSRLENAAALSPVVRVGHSELQPRPVTDHDGAQSALIPTLASRPEKRPHEVDEVNMKPSKRHCVSLACIACKTRRSKCDGVRSGCAACLIHETECVYDLSLDRRRKSTAERRSLPSRTFISHEK